MKPEIQALVDRYKSTPNLSEREKADIEAQIWALWPDRTVERRNMLRDLLDIRVNDSEVRFSLHRIGSLGDPLWARIEEKILPVPTAAKLLRQAKEQARSQGAHLQETLAQLIDEYDRRPYVKRSGNYTFRYGNPRPKTTFQPTLRVDDNDRGFWKWFRENVSKFLRTKMAGLEQVEVEALSQKFETDMRVLIDETYSKISRLKNQRKDIQSAATKYATRESLRVACHALNVEAPILGRPVDLAAANRNKKRLAADYHPDKHQGDETMRHRYEEVMNAFDVLERYNEQLKNPSGEATNGGSNHDHR